MIQQVSGAFCKGLGKDPPKEAGGIPCGITPSSNPTSSTSHVGMQSFISIASIHLPCVPEADPWLQALQGLLRHGDHRDHPPHHTLGPQPPANQEEEAWAQLALLQMRAEAGFRSTATLHPL